MRLHVSFGCSDEREVVAFTCVLDNYYQFTTVSNVINAELQWFFSGFSVPV